MADKMGLNANSINQSAAEHNENRIGSENQNDAGSVVPKKT